MLRMLKVLRQGDDDAIAQDRLRMRISDTTEPKHFTVNIRLFAGWIFIKFGMGVVPLENIKNK
jgi:hypothetical protein